MVADHQISLRGDNAMSEDLRNHGDATQISKKIVLIEYNRLKDEVLQRIGIRFQLVTLAVIAPGTILVFGLQNKNAPLMLIYPILSMFLTGAYASNDYQIRQIREYIKWIETKLHKQNMSWQYFTSDLVAKKPIELHQLSSLGIFCGIGLVTILGSLPFLTYNLSNVILLVISIGCVCMIPLILYGSTRVKVVVDSGDGAVAGPSLSLLRPPLQAQYNYLRRKVQKWFGKADRQIGTSSAESQD
jgi:hypothetical protein